MRNTRGCYNLYAEDGARVVRQMKTGESNYALAAGSVCWHRNKKGDIIGLRLICQPRQSRAYNGIPVRSGPTLTMGEIDANASGCVTPSKRKPGINCYGAADEMIVGNFIDQAMTKVEQWEGVHDTRAVVISAGKVHGAILVESIPDRVINFA